MGTDERRGVVNPANKSYRELLVEAAERGATSPTKMKNNYIKLVESSRGDETLKQRLIRIAKVLDEWELIKLHLFLSPQEISYLEGLNLKADETYFVQAGDRLQLDKFKSFYLMLDGTDFMPKVTDLSTLVSEDLGESEAINTADIERGGSNINIIYIRKNMGLMGRGNDLYINTLLNHVSFRRSKHRKTLILSEVLIREITESGEVKPIIISNDKLRSSSGKATPIPTLSPVGSNSTTQDDKNVARKTYNEPYKTSWQEVNEKKARESQRAQRFQ